jgi:hypothetical protein
VPGEVVQEVGLDGVQLAELSVLKQTLGAGTLEFDQQPVRGLQRHAVVQAVGGVNDGKFFTQRSHLMDWEKPEPVNIAPPGTGASSSQPEPMEVDERPAPAAASPAAAASSAVGAAAEEADQQELANIALRIVQALSSNTDPLGLLVRKLRAEHARSILRACDSCDANAKNCRSCALVSFSEDGGYVDCSDAQLDPLKDAVGRAIMTAEKAEGAGACYNLESEAGRRSLYKTMTRRSDVATTSIRTALLECLEATRLDAPNAPLNLRGNKVVVVEGGMPKLVPRSTEHFVRRSTGVDASWLEEHLADEHQRRQYVELQEQIPRYIPNPVVRQYLLCLLGDVLFGTKAARTKIGVLIVGNPDQGKTTLSKLLTSAAGEYSAPRGEAGAEKEALSGSRSAFWRLFTSVNADVHGTQFLYFDELEQGGFNWVKYKDFMTSGDLTITKGGGTSSQNRIVRTPMPIISCNVAQAPQKPTRADGALPKVVVFTPSMLGQFKGGGSSEGAAWAERAMKGEFRGPVLRLLYETLRGFVEDKGRAFDFVEDMPAELESARNAWDFSQPAPSDPSSAAGPRGAAPSAAPPVAAPSAAASSSAAALQGAPPSGQQGNSPVEEPKTLVDALRKLYERCDGEFTTRASMYAKVASSYPAVWQAFGTDDQRAPASRTREATPSSHDPFTHIVASQNAPRSVPQATPRSNKKRARRFPMLLSGR